MKRGFKKSLALLLAMLMSISALGISVSAASELVNITISPSSLTLDEKDTAQLSVTAVYQDYSTKTNPEGVRWSSEDDTFVKVSSTGFVTAQKITDGAVVKIYANYTEGGVSKEAYCEVKVAKAPVLVDKISWAWEATALYAGTSKVYSFAYEEGSKNNKYSLIPDKPDVTTATLTCSPADALQIDNVNKTFKVNPIDKETLPVTLTLTADGASPSCKPVSKTFTIYRDIPITRVAWTFKDGTRDPLYNYYENESKKIVAEYYFMPTDMGSPAQDYKFTIYPQSLKYESIAELCEVTFTSSDERVVVFNEETGRIIPIGNGESDLTIMIKTPKGKVFKDTVTAHVRKSPYGPVMKARIGFDEKKTDVDAVEYNKDNDTLTLMFSNQIQLTAQLNKDAVDTETDKAKYQDAAVDEKATKQIYVLLDNGEEITVKPAKFTWKIDDESIATVDQNGLVKAGSGKGTATITLTVDDNGHKYEDTVKFRAKMPWWEVLIAILMSLFTGNWSKIPKYFGMLFN